MLTFLQFSKTLIELCPQTLVDRLGAIALLERLVAFGSEMLALGLLSGYGIPTK